MHEYLQRKISLWSKLVISPDVIRSFKIASVITGVIAVIAAIAGYKPLVFGCACGIFLTVIVYGISFIASLRVISYSEQLIQYLIQEYKN